MFKPCCFLGGLILALCLTVSSVHAQPTITNVNVGTAFRYQGAVRGVFPNTVFPSGAQNGTLQFQFGLWDDPVNTDPAARMASNIFSTLNVSNGFFSTMLDFGDVFKGQRAFLEVSVYAPSNTFPASSNWITVSPRTEIGAVPYAMYAAKGGTETFQGSGSVSLRAGSTDGRRTAIIFRYTDYYLQGYGSKPKVVEEVAVRVAVKRLYTHDGRQPVTPCLSCSVAVTLEVWRMTNSVTVSPGGGGYLGFVAHEEAEEYVRTLSEPVIFEVGTAPLLQWFTLPMTNSLRRLETGESLRVAIRSTYDGPGVAYVSEHLGFVAQAILRDAP